MVILYKNGIISLQKVRSEHTVWLPEKAGRKWQCKRIGERRGRWAGHPLHLLQRKCFKKEGDVTVPSAAESSSKVMMEK